MQHTLKLTITAVGENDSVFLTPCDPVTLHESCVENPEGNDEAAEHDDVLTGPASRGGDDVMVMFDD